MKKFVIFGIIIIFLVSISLFIFVVNAIDVSQSTSKWADYNFIGMIRLLHTNDSDLGAGKAVCFKGNQTVGACSGLGDERIAGVISNDFGFTLITPSLQLQFESDNNLANNLTVIVTHGITNAFVDCTTNSTEIGEALVAANSRGNLHPIKIIRGFNNNVVTKSLVGNITSAIVGKALKNCNKGDGIVLMEVLIG